MSNSTTQEIIDFFLAHPSADGKTTQVLWMEDGITYAGILFHAFVKHGALCIVANWFSKKTLYGPWVVWDTNFAPRLNLDTVSASLKDGHITISCTVGFKLIVNLEGKRLFRIDADDGIAADPNVDVAPASNLN